MCSPDDFSETVCRRMIVVNRKIQFGIPPNLPPRVTSGGSDLANAIATALKRPFRLRPIASILKAHDVDGFGVLVHRSAQKKMM